MNNWGFEPGDLMVVNTNMPIGLFAVNQTGKVYIKITIKLNPGELVLMLGQHPHSEVIALRLLARGQIGYLYPSEVSLFK